MPRDRNGSFEPKIVEKGQTHFDGFDDKIISIYAGEMTMRRSAATSPTSTASLFRRISSPRSPTRSSMISRRGRTGLWTRVTRSVWVDALVVMIRTDGVVRNRPAYLVLGSNVDGRKEALGLWIGRGGESAKFWLKIFNDIKTGAPRPSVWCVATG